MVRNKAIATGLAIGLVGIGANAAPGLASPGGIAPSTTGGVAPEKSPHHSNFAAKIHYIRECIRKDTQLQAFTLDPEAGSLDADSVQVTQTDGTGKGMEINNPVAILTADGGNIAAYVGRPYEGVLEIMSASKANVVAYAGNVAIPVPNPSDLLTPHTLRSTPDENGEVTGFIAENGETFAQMP